MLISLLLIYTATVTMYRIAFIDVESQAWLIADTVIDGLFLTDVVVNCFLCYYDFEMNLVTRHRLIVTHYLKTWMVMDLIACLPFQYIFGADKNYSNVVRVARLPRLYKLIKVTKMMRMLKIFKEQTSLNRHFKGFLRLSLGIERLIWMLTSFLLLIHLIACFWAFMGKTDDTYENWIFAGSYNDKSPFELYVISFYWAITTLSTVGYGDISAHNSAERLMCSLTMLIGIFVYSYVISSITNLLGNLDTRKTELSKKMGLLNELARQFKMSKLFYKKLSKAIEYENSRSISAELTDMINGLPSKMRSELLYVIHKKMIESNDFFVNKALVFVAEVTELLRPLRTEMQEIVYRDDEIAVEMYLIYKGEVSFVISASHNAYLTVGENYYFGECDILVNDKGRHSATVVTTNVCEFFTIEKEGLLALLEKYPETKFEMLTLARERLERNKELKKQAYAELKATAKLTRVNSIPKSFISKTKFVNAIIKKNIEEVDEDNSECESDVESQESEKLNSVDETRSSSDVQIKPIKRKSEVNIYDIMQRLTSSNAPGKPVPRTATYLRLKKRVGRLEENITDIQLTQTVIIGRLDSIIERFGFRLGSI
jgi:hypothetical protein